MYAELRARYGVAARCEGMTDWQVKEQFNPRTARDWGRLAEFLVQCKQLKEQN